MKSLLKTEVYFQVNYLKLKCRLIKRTFFQNLKTGWGNHLQINIFDMETIIASTYANIIFDLNAQFSTRFLGVHKYRPDFKLLPTPTIWCVSWRCSRITADETSWLTMQWFYKFEISWVRWGFCDILPKNSTRSTVSGTSQACEEILQSLWQYVNLRAIFL